MQVTELSTDRDDRGTHAWVSVGEAAERAGVDTGTVRHWYRSGQFPTLRTQSGAFLVPLSAVLSLVDDRGTTAGGSSSADDIEVIWSLQADGATAEADAARRAASELRQRLTVAEEELGFLRRQLAETSEDARNLRNQLEAAAAETQQARSEVDRLRKEAAEAGSITDFAWLERAPIYESPVRPQQFRSDLVSELFASVQKGPDSLPAGVKAVPENSRPEEDALEEVEALSKLENPEDPPPAPSPKRQRRGYGHHADDVVPHSRKWRR